MIHDDLVTQLSRRPQLAHIPTSRSLSAGSRDLAKFLDSAHKDKARNVGVGEDKQQNVEKEANHEISAFST